MKASDISTLVFKVFKFLENDEVFKGLSADDKLVVLSTATESQRVMINTAFQLKYMTDCFSGRIK